MTGEQNWRAETNAQDYFTHQRKATDLADRRPVIRSASDLGLGPGVAAQAVVITDYNDLLATYNGWFSAVAGTFGAPNVDEDFVGFTIMDATMGGVQTFTGMDSGWTYRRTFKRNPSDASSIFWSSWERSGGMNPVGTVVAFAGTLAPTDWLICNAGSLSTTAYPSLFSVIGYSFGGSGGSFTLPDLRARTPYGVGGEWDYAESDGLTLANRTQVLTHEHGLSIGTAGSHDHTISSDGNHIHTATTGTPSATTLVPASPNAAAVGGPNHTHGVTVQAAGNHSHGASTGNSGTHAHGGETNGWASGKPLPSLRGVGMNWIIRAK